MTATVPVKPAVVSEATEAIRAAIVEIKRLSGRVDLVARLEAANRELHAATVDDSTADLQGGF